MMKKYLHISIVMLQCAHIFAGEKQERRTSGTKDKCRISLSQSQPILIVSEKIKHNRLSQSSPNLLQAYSPSPYSPNGYYELGNLGEGFSPCAYDSSR